MKKATSKPTNNEVSAEAALEAANADYEARKAAGGAVSIGEIEKEHGLEAGKLGNWRSNKKRLKSAVQVAPVAITGSTTTNGATLIRVPLNWVKVCPLNPRKKLDPAGIDEMARSILEHGIIQPPVAREHPKGSGQYEVVFGQRRLCGLLRAKEIARAEKLPEPRYEIDLLLREMDDRTVIEEAWVENLQRVDVSVREEAQGFEDLLELMDDEGQPLYTVNRLAKTFGKDPALISRRLKLKGVPEDLWKALDEELVGVRQLELVGCLPTQEMREKAAKAVLNPKFRPADVPLTVKETRALIRDEFMVSLSGVEWDLKDETLVEPVTDEADRRIYGGACHDCPMRTGRNPELQESLSDGKGGRGWKGNSCMRPDCYQKKKSAIWKRTKAEAVESGAKVLTDQEAKKTFSQWGGEDQLERSAGMVVLSTAPGYEETGHYAGEETLPSWQEMIGEALPAAEVILARNPKTGAIKRLLPKKLAIELAEKSLKEQGKESPFQKRKKEKESSGPKEKSEWEIERMVKERSAKQVSDWLRKKGQEGVLFGALAQEEFAVALAWEAVEYQGASDICEALGIPIAETTDRDMEEIEQKLEAEIRASMQKGQTWWLLVEIFCALNGNLGYSIGGNNGNTHVKRLLEVIGVPLDAIINATKDEVEAEEKARLKEGKKTKKAA